MCDRARWASAQNPAGSSLHSFAKGIAMRASIKRILTVVAFGLACAMGGAYVGINQAYDRLSDDLPAMIGSAVCSASQVEPFAL
jgi:hypothetical protein